MVEGSSEHAIMDILIKNDLLKFNVDTLIQNSSGQDVFEGLSGNRFAQDFLGHEFDEDITLHVIMDDPKRQLKFQRNIKKSLAISRYITREEIEAVHLYKDPSWKAAYNKFCNKQSIKPSDFFKSELKIKNIKSPQLSNQVQH